MLADGDGPVVVRTEAGDWRGLGAAIVVMIVNSIALLVDGSLLDFWKKGLVPLEGRAGYRA